MLTIIAIVMATAVLALVDFTGATPAISWLFNLDRWCVFLAVGSAVVVESVDGLTLTVRPAEKWEVH